MRQMKSKKAQAGNVLWFVVLLVVVFAFAYILMYILGKGAGTLDDVFVECSGIGGGVWTAERCNPSVSVESPVVPRTEGYICCIPLPGIRERFEEVYADDFKLDINKNGVKSGGSSGSGSSSSGSTNKGPIQFVLNGNDISKATSTLYTAGMPTNGIILSEDEQTFQVVQTLKEQLGKCSISIYPAKIDEGTQKIYSNTVADEDHKITFEQEACEKSITVSKVKLALLDGNYAEPGFYKWDFKYWKDGNTGEQWDGSETTFIGIKEGVAGPEEGSLKLVTYTQRVSRNNVATCYLFVGVIDDADNERLPVNSTYMYSEADVEDITKLPITINLKPQAGLNSVAFNFAEKNVVDSPFQTSYTFDECNEVVVFDLNYYKSNYQTCSNMLCDYTRDSCLTTGFRNPGNSCTKDVENCYWDWILLGGACMKCDSNIKSCSDYDKQTCASNQCFDGVNMRDRCYVNKNKDCAACNLDTSSVACEDYKKKSICEDDPCNYKGLMNKTCKWESGNCVIA